MSSDRNTGAASAPTRSRTAVARITAKPGRSAMPRRTVTAATAQRAPCPSATTMKPPISRSNWAMSPTASAASSSRASNSSSFGAEMIRLVVQPIGYPGRSAVSDAAGAERRYCRKGLEGKPRSSRGPRRPHLTDVHRRPIQSNPGDEKSVAAQWRASLAWRMSSEISLDRADQAAGELLLIGRLLQQTLFDRVRETAELDKGGRDVQRRQHGKIGRALRVVEQHDLARELVEHFAREHDRQI